MECQLPNSDSFWKAFLHKPLFGMGKSHFGNRKSAIVLRKLNSSGSSVNKCAALINIFDLVSLKLD